MQDFSGLTAAERLALIRLIHQNTWVGPNDESALERIWRAPGMDEEAARNQALYAESRERGADLPASATTFGRFTNRVAQNMTEGVTTVVEGRFDWTLTDRLRVQVGVHFVADSGVTAPIAEWRGQIDSWWNQFSVIDGAAPTTAIPIDFNLVDNASDPRTIRVHQNRRPGRISPEDRADAANYYVTMNPATAPHEFGHLIGLQDEYQRTHGDFRRVTGITPTAGPGNTSAAVAADVATELHNALSGPAAQRATTVQNVCNTYNIVEGNWAQEVMRAYDTAHPDRTLYQAIRHYLAVTDRFWISQRFAYSTRSVMGLSNDPTATSHSHPVEPRHLREFASIVRRRFPGRNWLVRHR
ncbi:MAG TPA: hypothetical protein VM143_12680 [Acidimicrobiales bacterium]|nr:hypothetical protein [Acidimicrobiales bacterium]